jgi:hypothetical protein
VRGHPAAGRSALASHEQSNDLGRVAGRITVAAAAVFRSVQRMTYIICERFPAAVTAIVPTPNDRSSHDSRPPGFRSPRAPFVGTRSLGHRRAARAIPYQWYPTGPHNSTAMMRPISWPAIAKKSGELCRTANC